MEAQQCSNSVNYSVLTLVALVLNVVNKHMCGNCEGWGGSQVSSLNSIFGNIEIYGQENGNTILSPPLFPFPPFDCTGTADVGRISNKAVSILEALYSGILERFLVRRGHHRNQQVQQNLFGYDVEIQSGKSKA